MLKKSFVLFLMLTTTCFANQEKVDCQTALKQNSSDWINAYSEKQGGSTIDIVEAIQAYGLCYQQRIDDMKAALGKSSKGPLMGANAEFRDFTKELNQFTQLALKASAGGGSFDRITANFAMLYQKQFAYLFYQSYLNKREESFDPVKLQQAKDYLNKRINELPKAQAEEIKASFQALLKEGKLGLGLPELQIVKFAISLLQSPADKAYSPPAF